VTNSQRAFFPKSEILREIRLALGQCRGNTDYVTFVGEGEPTLCRDLGFLIERTKEWTNLPIAVITNGSLLYRKEVRRDLLQADVVLPSLDVTDQAAFVKLNRPHKTLEISKIIAGMTQFRDQFTGQLWMEVMLVRGVNDSVDELLKIEDALRQIAPDRVYVNVPVRPPAESWVAPPEPESLSLVRSILENAYVHEHPESGSFDIAEHGDPLVSVLMIIRRHPMRRDQIAKTLHALSPLAIEEAIDELEAAGRIQQISYRGESFYTFPEGRYGKKR
jgi:wyosine [tRNA(Phe)-imidazoG37] synthetase (radical SAM superfamily)